MPLIGFLLCVLGLWVWCKISDRDQPWQKVRRQATRDYNDGKITWDEWFELQNESFRMQHGLTKEQYDPSKYKKKDS